MSKVVRPAHVVRVRRGGGGEKRLCAFIPFRRQEDLAHPAVRFSDLLAAAGSSGALERLVFGAYLLVERLIEPGEIGERRKTSAR